MWLFNFLKKSKKNDSVWKDQDGNIITDATIISELNSKIKDEPDYIIAPNKIIENNFEDELELEMLLEEQIQQERENEQNLIDDYLEYELNSKY